MKFCRTFFLYFLIIFICFFTRGIKAQDNFGIGANFGIGTIGGNLPSQGSFNTTVFVQGNPGFTGNYSVRLTFVYATAMNVLLPTLTDRYTSYIKGFSIKGMQSQSSEHSLYSEEGLGFLALNDRTFATFNKWDYGIVFSVLVGLDLRQGAEKGFKIGVGGEYGLTFTGTSVRYLAAYLQSILFF